MAKTTGWREQVSALPDSFFPHKAFEDRDDMLAGIEWFAANGTGGVKDKIDTTDLTRIINAAGWQWAARKEELAKAKHAREQKRAPLQAKRDQLKKVRLAERAITVDNLRSDLRETFAVLDKGMKPGFGKIDWDALRPTIGHLASLYTRLRFQAGSAKRISDKAAARARLEAEL